MRNFEEFDELTQLYTVESAERIAGTLLNDGGVLVLCDIDSFRKINSRYGHPAGDRCLKSVADVLKYMAGYGAVIARVRGDRFLIYTTAVREKSAIAEFIDRIQKRFASFTTAEGATIRITAGYTSYREHDTFQVMYQRAERDLEGNKKRRKTSNAGKGEPTKWEKDMTFLRGELEEGMDMTGGAFCQDFETFKLICQFVTRGMLRTDMAASIALISICDNEGQVMTPVNNAELMMDFGNMIHDALRVGDAYARYSNCQ